MTSKQVKELCESEGLEDAPADPIKKLPAQAVKVAKMTQSVSTTAPQDIAQAFMRQEGNAMMGRARLQALQKLLLEAEHYLESD